MRRFSLSFSNSNFRWVPSAETTRPFDHVAFSTGTSCTCVCVVHEASPINNDIPTSARFTGIPPLDPLTAPLSSFCRLCHDLAVAETVDLVIVDHADGLHHRVTDGGSDKLEPTLEQVFAEQV